MTDHDLLVARNARAAERRKARQTMLIDGIGAMTFQQWLRAVNAHCLEIAGVGLDDIGDWETHDNWTCGTNPRDAARMALAESDFPFGDTQVCPVCGRAPIDGPCNHA